MKEPAVMGTDIEDDMGGFAGTGQPQHLPVGVQPRGRQAEHFLEAGACGLGDQATKDFSDHSLVYCLKASSIFKHGREVDGIYFLSDTVFRIPSL